jgi:hypothetical protein
VAVRPLFDFGWRQSGEELPGQDAEERITQTVDPFEVLEEQDQPFEMGGVELTVDAVKRVRHGMGDLRFLEISLKLINVLAETSDLGVLRFRYSPNQQMNFARILRKIRGNFLTDKRIG